MRIVQYQTASIRGCEACDGTHASMTLYQVAWATVSQPGWLAFVCPNRDDVIVVFERSRMEEAEPKP